MQRNLSVQKVDEFIRIRVCQPVADFTQRMLCVNCFGLARVCSVILALLVGMFQPTDNWLEIMGAVGFVSVVLSLCVRAVERQYRAGNRSEFYDVGLARWRVLLAGAFVMSAAGIVVAAVYDAYVFEMCASSTFLAVVVLFSYFIMCEDAVHTSSQARTSPNRYW